MVSFSQLRSRQECNWTRVIVYLLIPSRSPPSLKARKVMSLKEHLSTCIIEIMEHPALKCLILATCAYLLLPLVWNSSSRITGLHGWRLYAYIKDSHLQPLYARTWESWGFDGNWRWTLQMMGKKITRSRTVACTYCNHMKKQWLYHLGWKSHNQSATADLKWSHFEMKTHSWCAIYFLAAPSYSLLI